MIKINKFFKRLLKFSFLGITLVAAVFVVFFANEKKLLSNFFPKSDILHESLDIITKNYFDSSLIIPKRMFEEALKELSRQLPPVLVKFSDKTDENILYITTGANEKSFDYRQLESVTDLDDLLQEVLLFVKQNISKDDIDNFSTVDYAVINGILSSLDPHSNLLTPQIYEDFTADAQGKYAGVGMVIRDKEGKIEIVAMVAENAPADIAGLKPGDMILKIDGQSAIGISVEDAKNKLRGIKNSTVLVEVERKGEATPLTFKITRDDIKLSSVKSLRFDFEDGQSLGYIFISRVLANTHDELIESLLNIDSDLSKFKGLVLDLRNNPGGLLNRAVDIANTFLNDGVIVSIAGVNKKNIIKYNAKPFGTTKNFPIVILVNRFSASASEIIASALQKNNRAIVIGEKTFGKGTVQSLVEKFSDGSALKLTTSQYLTPGERSIQSLGVTPEVWLASEIINDNLVRILPTSNQLEKGLDNSLSLATDELPEKSKFKLNYLDNLIAADEDEYLSFYNKLNPEKLEKDFWIQAAFEILKNTPSSKYEDLIKTAENYVTKESKTQGKKIVAELKNLNIDWEKTPFNKVDTIKNSLKVEIKLLKKQSNRYMPDNKPFAGNVEGRISVKATNTSGKYLSRVIGVIKSDNDLLDNKQLVFGNLEADQTVERTLNFKTRNFEVPGSSRLEIDFREFDQASFQKVTQKIYFADIDLPEFIYNYNFSATDEKDITAKDGNTIKLKVDITNLSKTDSGPASLAFKNGDIPFLSLDKGVINFKSILPAQTVRAEFEISLSGIPNDKKYDALIVFDLENYPILNATQKIELVHNRPALSFSNQPPKITIETKNQPTLTLIGAVVDDKKIKEVYIFHNQNKIFYNRLKEARNDSTFLIYPKLLDNEANNFVIFAVDNEGTRSQRVLKIAE